ncbi:uncharacterized protein VP01_1576g1 [Puccinia sorghi]|uniref:Reverse transcriptase Ty1/copia-type domain-containing protein n=1 Tax=Puccinia sorghi TaxID=27349 RepID=A0A0L6VHV0_9BASI|nr:uncharacterized protein VP01_1576g1 [Puccinia sorghi]
MADKKEKIINELTISEDPRWLDAARYEIEKCFDLDVWEAIKPFNGEKPLGCCWVLLMSLVNRHSYPTATFDISSAYLYCPIEEDVYRIYAILKMTGREKETRGNKQNKQSNHHTHSQKGTLNGNKSVEINKQREGKNIRRETVPQILQLAAGLRLDSRRMWFRRDLGIQLTLRSARSTRRCCGRSLRV